MEQKMGKYLNGQPINSEQISYNSVDKRNEGVVGSVNQRFSQDSSNTMNMNLRPADHNITVAARPVHYSIQTGEEFALEFMWERVNPRQQYIPNSSVEVNSGTTPVDLHGMLGASHAGSERRPDASSFPSVEKGKVQAPATASNASLREEKPASNLLQPETRTSSKSTRFHSQSSLGSRGGSSKMMKLLCSYGGTILPRPSDRKLRYVGGETHILSINKDISWVELKQKTYSLCNEPHSIKYQLPGEDIDALVSVSSDEDIQNMMEEYKVLEGGSQKLRMFLISNDVLDDSQLGLESMEGDSEVQYVVAVNGMDFGSRRNSIGMDLGNNLDELINSRVVRETSQIVANLAAGGTLHPEVVSSRANQSSQMEMPSSSHAFEANSLGYQVQTINREHPEWNSSHGFRQMDVLPTTDVKTTVPSSGGLQYDYGFRTSNSAPVAENLVSNPILGHMIPRQASNVGQPNVTSNTKAPGVPGLEINEDNKTEPDKDHSLESNIPRMDKQMNKESSIQRINESTKVECVDDEKTISSDPYTVSSSNNTKSDEASADFAATDKGILVAPTKRSEEEDVNNYVPPNIVPFEEMNKFDEDDHSYTSGMAFMNDSSHEPDILPQPLFRSERIHREQAGLNRWSKSDDSFGPQLLMSRSDVSQHISESVDKLTDWNVTDNLEKVDAFTKSKGVDSLITNEKLHGSSKLMADDKTESDHKAELNAAVAPNVVMLNQGISEHPQEDSAHSKIKETSAEVKLQDMGAGDVPFVATSQSDHQFGAGTPEHENILIDINDRFPHDFLSDVFSKDRIDESYAGVTSLQGYAAGLSVNIINHEPKSWSYFQNLAHDDSRSDVSLMDQDHRTFSSSQAIIGEHAAVDYSFPPFESGAVAKDTVDSSSKLDADNQSQPSGPVRPDTMNVPSDYDIPQTSGIQILPSNHPTNLRTAGSNHEDGKKATQPTGFPLVDLFDPSSLQIINNRDLEELRELGSGTYGTVYHGKWRGTDVAIKRIKKSCFMGRTSEQETLTSEFWHEAEILSKLHHPNVVAFYGVVQDGPGATLATVTEFMVNGSLRHVLISKERHLDRRKRLIIAMDAAFGMEYLHSRNIVHFDLKCDNLLVNLKDSSRPICKVGDFGLSKIKRNTLVTGGVRGTLPWMAPELLNGSSSKVSEKVDVFSFGIVLWEILTGEEPYANMHYGAIIGGIVNNTLRPPVPSFCDVEWRQLMEQCWAPDPVVRPSFTEIAARLRTMTATKTPPHAK
ncbi:hypothetical protein ACS0TY_019000 [Phlomoides rotata]